MGKQWQTLFLGAPKSLQMVTAAMKLKDTPWKESYNQPRQYIKKQRDITLPTKVRLGKAMVFPVVIWMWELDYKESWVLKNWCFWTVVLEKTLENPSESNETQPINSKGNWSWIFTWRTDAEAETPILWPPGVKNRLTGRPWCWERLKAGREGDHRGWDGWMASLTPWTWVWASSGSWWWTGKPGTLQSTGSQRIGHHWVTELNWTESWMPHQCQNIQRIFTTCFKDLL